uniref:Transmembrane protein 87A-like n=1 Tax=Phallusia mammillata TaxID=59560 RepID=A0A6F9DVG3_9ASCI|nr:transmembrane protein 87A-like [Phallusia mammillata]
MKFLALICIVTTFIKLSTQSAPEQGLWQMVLTADSPSASVVKTLYNQSTVSMTVTSKCEGEFEFHWYIRGTTCLGTGNLFSKVHPDSPNERFNDAEVGEFLDDQPTTKTCNEATVLKKRIDWKSIPAPEVRNDTSGSKKSIRAADADPIKQHPDPSISLTTTVKGKAVTGKGFYEVAVVQMQGEFTLVFWVSALNDDADANKVTVKVEMKTTLGYLSAHEYPLLTFYLIMCIVYALFAAAWFVMSACNYRDLLRVQFWIGGVILLAMIENAVFYSEYLNVNTTGISVMGATKFAEIVSALKRSVARMLVIIVSLGFGIVKPRLGPMLHRVIGVGILYFVLAVVEAMVRNDAALHDSEKNKSIMFAFLPLAILDSIICWWIFVSLLQTMKTLRLRRNTTKLSLYRHFSNLIIFCVLASVTMLLWSISLHNKVCLSDWSELWMDTAFWPILFSVILLVIMILWRPTANNQRYAYSPMIDGNDSELDEMEESMLGSGATEGMKMRSSKKTDHDKDVDKTEEDLKWIEENIPQTLADAALPALLDSDEEVLTTKYEMSKME